MAEATSSTSPDAGADAGAGGGGQGLDFFFFFFRIFGWPPVTGTGISRYRYRHRHPVPDRYRIHPVSYPVPTLIRYRHPELDGGFGYWIPVIGYRYRQIPVPDDGPDDDRRTLSNGEGQQQSSKGRKDTARE